MKKIIVFLLGYPVAQNPTSREAFLLEESDVTYKKTCTFHHRAIVNGNHIYSKTASILSKLVNHVVVTQHGSVGMVRYFVDVGSEVGYPVMTTRCTIRD